MIELDRHIDLLSGVTNLVGDSGHGALAAGGAISGSRATVQAGNGSGTLELGASLGRSTGLSSELLLGRGGLIHLLRRRGLSEGLLLLLLRMLLVDLLVGVLVDGRLLMASNVGRLWVLVHGDYLNVNRYSAWCFDHGARC